MQDLDKEFHIKCTKDDIGKYCILCGDPGRVPKIAKLLDNAKSVSHNREYNIYTGYLEGEKTTVCSHGIGAPSTAIALVELNNCGADTFIRVGTCGGIDLNVKSGDIVVATGAIRFEHTSSEFAPLAYPAVSDLDIALALREASREMGKRTHTGIVHCKDSFYGQHAPEDSPVANSLISMWDTWKRLKVKSSEMESSAAFVISDSLNCRCGACFHTIWNQERENLGLDQDMDEDSSAAIKVAVEGMRKIILLDKKKNKKKKKAKNNKKSSNEITSNY